MAGTPQHPFSLPALAAEPLPQDYGHSGSVRLAVGNDGTEVLLGQHEVPDPSTEQGAQQGRVQLWGTSGEALGHAGGSRRAARG